MANYLYFSQKYILPKHMVQTIQELYGITHCSSMLFSITAEMYAAFIVAKPNTS
jgi:hypothetical protein